MDTLCRIIPIKTFIIFIILLSSHLAFADYKVGPEDQLEIKFWQDKDLNTLVRVSLNGTITLDIIGEISVKDKTTTQIQNEIVKKISRLNNSISQVVVRVISYNYQYIFVSGEVKKPGKFTFEKIPDIWTIINEAGNITESGDLSRVTIIRGGKEAGKVEIVNVSEAISNGTLNNLPEIDREDTIEIPRSPAGLPTGELSRQIDRKNLIYILGAVNRPGAIKFEENIDLLEALAYAGGPTEKADLSKVKVISKDGAYATTILIDLEEYSKKGKPARYIVMKEDTFIIPFKKAGGLFGIDWGTIATVAGIATSGLLIYSRAKGDSR